MLVRDGASCQRVIADNLTLIIRDDIGSTRPGGLVSQRTPFQPLVEE